MIQRRKTKQVIVGTVPVGGDAPVSIQSMTNTQTHDIAATVAQIEALQGAGCDIVRVAVPDRQAAASLAEIKRAVQLPVVADIHFDYRLALLAIENGADKIRINPGNIGSEKRVAAVLVAAGERNIPVRIGVNAGSLEKTLLKQYGGVTAEALVESALTHVRFCEQEGFGNLVLSVKSSDVVLMIEANRMLAERTACPLHLGVTEAGSPGSGIVRSAVGIGALLAEGIGDTIRVSLTGDPIAEIPAARKILASLDLRDNGVRVISCPTCGRTHSNLAGIVDAVEKAVAGYSKNMTVAIMGCEVNGPGEAREADIGIACGKGNALLFRNGTPVRKIPFAEILNIVTDEVARFRNR